MKLGLLTACLPELSLSDLAAWAAAEGFSALEVAAWPAEDDRSGAPTHLAAEELDDTTAARVCEMLGRHGLTVSSLAYYANNLHPDLDVRAQTNAHVRACIDAAARLECPTVGTFIGRDITRSVAENLEEAAAVFAPLVDHAQRQGVRIVIENCPMASWHPDRYPGNLAYSPELWDWLAENGLYLNFDPSHLPPLGIDPVTAMVPHLDRVAHVQAKDVQLFPELRQRYGFYGPAVRRPEPGDHGWWRYRVPGLGEVEWKRIVDALYEAGYEGTISVEHEDPVWSGDEEQVTDGLRIARNQLARLIIR